MVLTKDHLSQYLIKACITFGSNGDLVFLWRTSGLTLAEEISSQNLPDESLLNPRPTDTVNIKMVL